jgi:hypothetical protein
MANTNQSRVAWQDRLIQELSRDKKKTAILTVLIFVGLFVVGRALTKKSKAEMVDSSESLIIPQSVAPDVAGSGGVMVVASAGVNETPWVRSMPIPSEGRDLFAFHLEHYEPANPGEGQEAEQIDGEGIPEEAAEPVQDAASVIRQRAAELELQSVMLSGSPVAVINGNVVGVGERIAGFEVVAIEAGQCLLRQDGVEVRLKMPE